MIVGDRVRLEKQYEGLPPGAAGRVAGFYRRLMGEQIAVVFDGGRCIAVPLEMLAPLSDPSDARDQPCPGDDPPRHLTW